MRFCVKEDFDRTQTLHDYFSELQKTGMQHWCVNDSSSVFLENTVNSFKQRTLEIRIELCVDEPHCEKDQEKIKKYLSGILVSVQIFQDKMIFTERKQKPIT